MKMLHNKIIDKGKQTGRLLVGSLRHKWSLLRNPKTSIDELTHNEIISVRAEDIKRKGSNFIIQECPQYKTAIMLLRNPNISPEDTPYFHFAADQFNYMKDDPSVKDSPMERTIDFFQLFNSLTREGYRPDIYGHIEVMIDDFGEIKLYEGHHRFAILRALDPSKVLDVKVIQRTKHWLDFKNSIYENCQYKRSTYQPILHPDFNNWEVHYDEGSRFESVLKIIGDPKGKRILDIGIQNGYFSFRLAKLGAEVTGIDNQERWVGLAERFNFVFRTEISFHCNDFVNVLCHYHSKKWDYGLFLNVFHWFLSQKEGNIKIVKGSMELLAKRLDAMFFSTGTYDESAVRDTPFARKISSDHIPDWICENTQFTDSKLLLTDQKGRKLYYFTK